MRGVPISEDIVGKIRILRSKGKSVSEISKEVEKSNSIVSRYIQGVKIQPEYASLLKEKQGGSKARAKAEWLKKLDESRILITSLTSKEKMLILASLYWGEGTKRELNVINSDPAMLKVIVCCLRELGVQTQEFRVTLRIYDDLNKKKAVQFWSNSLELPESCFVSVNVLHGKKEGKLVYGMCRVRVAKGAKYFKLIMSIIERIKELLS